MWRKLRTVLESVVALVPLMIVRALRPLMLIRFGPLRSERLGHFAANTELYLCEREAGLHGRRTLDIFYHTPPICNRQLARMWERRLRVWKAARWLDRLNRRLPGGGAHVIPMPSDIDIRGLLPKMPAHLTFTPEEEDQARKGLRALSIPEGVPLVCLHSRDAAYLAQALPGSDWGYHDFRNSSIANFVPAAEELARRGYVVVRTGAAVAQPMPSNHARIVDYAVCGRTALLDVYLAAACRFYLGDTCGFDALPRVFRKPLAVVNVVQLSSARTEQAIIILKQFWSRELHRALTLEEIFASRAAWYARREQFAQAGIELIENSGEEIAALAIEMDERLNGTWQATAEDAQLQARFQAIFAPHMTDGLQAPRLGAAFLRQHQALLGDRVACAS